MLYSAGRRIKAVKPAPGADVNAAPLVFGNARHLVAGYTVGRGVGDEMLLPGVQLSIIGLATRLMIILELGPLLTGLVLTGRVGGRMTAEIGTMRVTEQIDALETLAYDPVAFLIVPRLLAATIMLPVLVVLADATGVMSGYLVASKVTDVTPRDFIEGLRLGFEPFQVFYSLFKAMMFGIAIALVCSYEGYITEAGAEGVGRSTARAVVIASVTILVLDALTAFLLQPLLQT